MCSAVSASASWRGPRRCKWRVPWWHVKRTIHRTFALIMEGRISGAGRPHGRGRGASAARSAQRDGGEVAGAGNGGQRTWRSVARGVGTEEAGRTPNMHRTCQTCKRGRPGARRRPTILCGRHPTRARYAELRRQGPVTHKAKGACALHLAPCWRTVLCGSAPHT
jgi:hypothetical protein